MIEEIQRKKAVVGSLLSMTLQKDSRFQFAFWYRVVGDTKKILKMQTLKTTNVLTYRCSVFDVGAVIELRIEGALEEEVINFGPVKFDSYFNKQLEDPKNDKNQFMANLHTKFNQTIPVKIQIYINNNHLHLIFQSRPQNQSHFQLPLKQDWREYQSVFDVSAAKITDLYFRQSENKEKFIKNLQLLGVHAENRNFVLLTFSNLFERNLFLAQIIRRTLYTPDQPRNSQNKQLRCSQPRQSMQNQMDDLFKSSIMPRNSLASEKTYSEMKEVIFTPQIENQQTVEKGFNSNNFGNFLNPENDKKQANDILSNIQEDQMDSHEKSIRSIKKVAQIRDKTVRSTQKIASSSKYNDQDFVGVGEQLEWKKVAQQNKKLYLENKRLRCENNNLKKKLHLNKEENMKICYNIPEFIRREAKQKSKFASQSPSHIIRMTNVGQNELKQTIHEFETTQTLNMVRSSREQFYRTTQNWKSKSSQKMRTSDDHRRMAKTVSMNNRKSVKEILGLRQPKDI